MLPSIKIVHPGGGADRIVRLSGQIDPSSIHRAMDAMLSLANDSPEPIVLQISSSGGCVNAGMTLIDTMQSIEAPVFTIGIGLVASMAAVILLVGEPNYRYLLPRSRILLHAVYGQSAGKIQEIESATRLHREWDREISELVLAYTEIPRNRLSRLFREERFLTAREALKMGIIDHVL